jgi:hypothetical protein
MSVATRTGPESESGDDGALAVQLAELRADTRHVQGDLTDIKADVREARAKIDALRAELATAKIWALGLYIALAGSILFAMARGFKWI